MFWQLRGSRRIEEFCIGVEKNGIGCLEDSPSRKAIQMNLLVKLKETQTEAENKCKDSRAGGGELGIGTDLCDTAVYKIGNR